MCVFISIQNIGQSIPLNSDFFDYLEKWLDKKLGLNSKFMTSQTGKQIIAIHILPNISKSKGNQ